MAKLSPERIARIRAARQEEKERWLEHLRQYCTKKENFQHLCALLDFFTGLRWHELTDREYKELADEYWKMGKPGKAPAPLPTGTIPRPEGLTQEKIDSLMAWYADSGEPITENEAIIAWAKVTDWTRRLADMIKGERDEEGRASQE